MTTNYGPFKKVVVYRPRHHQIVKDGAIMQGLTKRLENFYPGWEFRKATKGPEHCRV
jgi:hypothetical protein